jgi:hypothetical protein
VAKLDRLGWADGIVFRAYGLDVGIRVNDPRVLERVERLLPYGWRPIDRSVVEHLYSLVAGDGEAERARTARFKMRRKHMLYSGAARLARTEDLDALYEVFESDLRRLVAEFSRTRVFLHAGVVAWGGRAILIPGRSFSGKTSLVAALVRAGATYYSDEFAVLDAKGRVHPFLKPLSIRESADGRQTEYPVEELGGRSGTKPIPVGTVLVTSYTSNSRWRPRPISAGRAALELFANAVSARHNPAQVFEALNAAVVGATALKGRRGEADEIAETILTTHERAAG